MYPATAFKYLERALQEGLGRRAFGSEDKRRVKEFFRDSCAYCDSDDGDGWDHLVPAISGGEWVLGNVVTACKPCNNSKGSRPFDTWMAARAIAKPDASWAAGTPARIERLREYQRQFGYVPTKAQSRLSPERLAQFEELVRRANELQRDIEAFLRPPKGEARAAEPTTEDGDGQGGESPRGIEKRVLEIAADHLEKDGYVVYDDFIALKPVDQIGSMSLFPIKLCLQKRGYGVHEGRYQAQWNGCGYPGRKTHFHSN
jgi:hypothetical protein